MTCKTYIGYNSIKNLKKIIKKNNPDALFLVTDKASYIKSGAAGCLEKILFGKRTFLFDDFRLNPSLEDVEKGIHCYKAFKPDAIIAVGGGTAIDMAKLINTFANQQSDPLSIINKEKPIEQKGKICIAVPTTAGTGSEATHFAVIYTDKIKHSIAHRFILPDYAIIDPAFTLTIPPYITASTGIDALSQGIESLWSVNSTDESRRYSKKAIFLAWNNLKRAVKNPDRKSRLHMAEAAHFSGKAINIAKTTAPHAFSYFFTSYHNIPHGHAVGLTLGKFLVYNDQAGDNDIADKRGAAYVKKRISEILRILKVKSTSAANQKINALMRDIGLETDLDKIGFDPENDIDKLLSNINLERLDNNPRKVRGKDIKGILTANI